MDIQWYLQNGQHRRIRVVRFDCHDGASPDGTRYEGGRELQRAGHARFDIPSY